MAPYMKKGVKARIGQFLARLGFGWFDIGAFEAHWIAKIEKTQHESKQREWQRICEIDQMHQWLGPWAQSMEARLKLLWNDPAIVTRTPQRTRSRILELYDDVAQIARGWDTVGSRYPWH